MEFAFNKEQQLVLKTTSDFARRELYPHEAEVEDSGRVPQELRRELKG